MFCLFQFFASCQASIQNFSKHYSKLKHFKGGDYYYYNCHKIIQRTSFLIFWLHKKISITLKYSGDILRIFLEQKFVECSSNILVTLLCDYWILAKDRHLLLSNHTLLTQKQIFSQKYFVLIFSLKCSLNVTWMLETLQRWGNTQRIFLEYCVPAGIGLNVSQSMSW